MLDSKSKTAKQNSLSLFSSFFVVFLLVFTLFLGFMSYPVIGVLTYSTGFEDGTLTQQYSVSWLDTEKDEDVPSSHFYVGTHSYSGAKGFDLVSFGGEQAEGFFNYTYDSSDVMVKWECWLRITSSYPNSRSTFLFKNGSTNVILIHIGESAIDFQYTDIDTNLQTISNAVGSEWTYFSWEMTDIDTVIYTVNTTVVIGTVASVGGNNRIDRLFIDGAGSTAGEGIYLDNHKVLTSDDYEGSAVSDFSGYNTIGTLKVDVQQQVNDRIIEEKYFVPISADFVGLDLVVNPSQFSGDPILTNYVAYLNGNSLGSADFWIPYNGMYVLRWDFTNFPVVLDNEEPIIEFYHPVQLGTYYWLVGIGQNSDDDLDGDGEVTYRYDGIINGDFDGINRNWDLAYRLYYENLVYPEIYEYLFSDLIWCHGYSGTLSDGTPLYYNYTTVFLSYTLSTLTEATYIRVWNTDSDVEVGLTQGFGLAFRLGDYGRSKGFIPYSVGNYTASLYRGGENISNASFSVAQNPDTNKILYTIPNPSKDYQEYFIYYSYEHIDGWDGAIGMSLSPVINSESDCEFWIYIDSGSSGVFSYSHNLLQTHYWRIFTYMGNGTQEIGYGGIHKHYILNQGLGLDSIECLFDTVPLADNPQDQASMAIRYVHNFLGVNIVIKVNGVLFMSVSDVQASTVFYYPSAIGVNNVTLELYQNGTWILLAYDDFTVTGEEEPEEPILPPLDDSIRGLVGLIIVVALTLIPLVITASMGVAIEQVGIISTLFGGMGIVVSIYLGLLDMWVIFFIMVIVIAIVIIQYIRGR